MAKTRSMTRNQKNHGEIASSSRKRSKSCAPWSDLDHNLLFLVMMQLGVLYYLSFGGVCKSWRLLAISNRNTFMASRPPLYMRAPHQRAYKKVFCLEDHEGRKYKTILPRFPGGICFGLTCGYLVFFSERFHEFWLVNPITRHELRFPNFPIIFCDGDEFVRAIVVFSPSISAWVFLVRVDTSEILFSIAGKGAWNEIPCTLPIIDFHAFKGIIYTLTQNIYEPKRRWNIYKMRLNPEPEFTLLETNNFPEPKLFRPSFVSSDENLYVMDCISRDPYRFHELDFGEMKWVLYEKPKGKYAFFLSNLNKGIAVKPESWADPWSQFGRYDGSDFDSDGKMKFFTTKLWYFPSKCLNVDRIDQW